MKKTLAIIPVSTFSNAKTRLSPTLTATEREDLLKSMLKDVVKPLKDCIRETIVISSDKDVLNFVKDMDVTPLKEEKSTDLNGALHQALEWCSNRCNQVLIIPSDVPLLKKIHVESIVNIGEEFEMVIAPAKGGGTNALLCPPMSIRMKFGENSFFKHIKEAKMKKMSYNIYDSFYLSLDVNTAEDLGEIILHGKNTKTKAFLEKIPLKVLPNHGAERLKVKRGNQT